MVNANILVGAIFLVVFVTIIDSYRVYQLGKEVHRLHRLVAELQDGLQKTPVIATGDKKSREDSIVEEIETLVIEKPQVITEIKEEEEEEEEEKQK